MGEDGIVLAIVISQSVLEEAVLPYEFGGPGMVSFPITDGIAHRNVRRETQQGVTMIRHEQEQMDAPLSVFVIESCRIEKHLCRPGFRKRFAIDGAANPHMEDRIVPDPPRHVVNQSAAKSGILLFLWWQLVFTHVFILSTSSRHSSFQNAAADFGGWRSPSGMGKQTPKAQDFGAVPIVALRRQFAGRKK
jgi:hypothetical protein